MQEFKVKLGVRVGDRDKVELGFEAGLRFMVGFRVIACVIAWTGLRVKVVE